MKSELDQCVSALRRPLIVAAVFSGIVNLLMLTGAIFMLTVYDRVIPSGSVPTLIVLGLLAGAMYLAYGVFDLLRGRLLTQIGISIGESISPRIYDVVVRRCAQRERGVVDSVRDLDRLRAFMSSMGPVAFFDLPWLPVFLAVLFTFHFYIGLTVTIGALVLLVLMMVGNTLTKSAAKELTEASSERDMLVSRSQVNAETLHAMGMSYAMSARWNALSERVFKLTQQLSDTSGTVTTMSRTLRMALQSLVLAIGALLVIRQEATGGIIIAGSILSARALAPIEQVTGQWKNFIAARQSWGRLQRLLNANPGEEAGFALPVPYESLEVDGLSVTLPGTNKLLIRNVSFKIRAGQGLGIVGPTGSGKSTLARALVGMWPAAVGAVRLDGQDVARWPSSARGRFIGYLPQAVALFEGTIAQNIARFDPDADPASIVQAAREAGVHELISRMPQGYETKVSGDADGLSGGQMQRIALARALFGDPFLIVMDEPNSNLDDEGEAALRRAMTSAYGRGAIVVIVTHRPSALSTVDRVIVLQEGRVRMFGTTEEVLNSFAKRGAPKKSIAAKPKVPVLEAGEPGGRSIDEGVS